jgi:hypothetical protein
MRYCLANLVVGVGLGGCSIIYNANNIHGDAQTVDIEVVTDVNPSLLELDSVTPATIYEGAGDGGSKPALLVIQGKQIADDATVTVTSSLGTVTVAAVVLAHDHNFIAVTLNAPVDTTNDEGKHGDLAITVSQSGGAVTKVFPDDATPAGQPAVQLKFLDQLTTAITAPPPAGKLYSKIQTTALAFAKGPANRVVLRSMSSVMITGGINADGGAPAAGPGGCAGGDKDMNAPTTNTDGTTCIGAGFTPAGSLLSGNGGGGAGYTSAGDPGGGPGGAGGSRTGDAQISSYDSNVGAGGGGGASTSLLNGGVGGGGGGTVQIEAGGDVQIGAPGISAIGGAGTAGQSGVGQAGGGGGGAGGTVIVTAHGALTLPTIAVTAGGGGVSGNVSGGAGKSGRARVAASSGAAPAGAYVGPMFVAPPSYSTTMLTTLHFTGQPGSGDVTGRVLNAKGMLAGNPFAVNIVGSGEGDADVTLTAGYNNVCVTVKDGSAIVGDESTTCTEMAFLP